MAEKNPEFPDFIRLRQKGLFIFSILILGFLSFHFWEMNQKPILSAWTGTGITIELGGRVFRPGLLVYSQPPTIQKVIHDGGGFMSVGAVPASAGKDVLIQDTALRVETEKNGGIFIQQNPLSVKALWVLGRPLPLNRATAEDLDRIPGIGPGLARRIIEFRQALGSFSSLDQLKEVNGIKEKTYEKIKGYLTL
jgi:competence protein ComEA